MSNSHINKDFPKVLPSIRSISAQVQRSQSKSKISNEPHKHERSETEKRQKLQPLRRDPVSRKSNVGSRGRANKDSDGSRAQTLKKKNSKTKMTDQYHIPYRRSTPSPPPPYHNNNQPPVMNRVQSKSTDEDLPPKQSMYPPEGRKSFSSNLKAKTGWKAVKKTSKQVLPMVRRTSTGCCTTYVSTINFIRKKDSLMILIHCSLFLFLAGYLIFGACVLMKLDNGHRQASRGQQELQRLKSIRATTAERLLNISLNSILEKSRDAVLDTIFTSDALQAALTVFKTNRITFLPADHELELLSEEVLVHWEAKLEELLLKYHFISSLETSGVQLSKLQIKEIWDTPPGYSRTEDLFIPWTFWEAAVQSFCIMTTIGYTNRSPSGSGKTMGILYAIFGIPLYLFVVSVWSKRLMELLITITKTNNPSVVRKVSNDENRVPTPHWNNSPRDDSETPPLLVFLSTILTVAYVIGIGPLGCGAPSNAFGERLEAAFFALLTVRHPNPLPQGGESSIGFILYIFIGHLVLGTFIRSIKKSISSTLDKTFNSSLR